MKYRVRGTIAYNAEMLIEADSKQKAECIGEDRLADGSLDGFTLGEPTNDYEVWDVIELEN